MPANTIIVNGEIEYTLSDSKMPPLMTYLKRYSHEGMDDPEQEETIFAQMLLELAKAHYGDDFEFDECTINWNPDLKDAQVWVVTFLRGGVKSAFDGVNATFHDLARGR